MQLFLIFHNFFEKPQKLQKSQFLLGTLLPPVTLDLINFSKNCNFSNYSQFLEKSQKLQKSQFLLDTLVPPLPLEFSNFSKNCDFSNFSQFLLLRGKAWTYLGVFGWGCPAGTLEPLAYASPCINAIFLPYSRLGFKICLLSHSN